MTRDEISALLPFLANETLTGDERAEVEAAVAEDAGLQSELAALQAIRATMQADEGYSPGEIGLARLMRDVGKDAPRQRIRRPLVWQAVAAALLAVVVAQAVFQFRGTDPGGYQLAGGEDAPFTVAFAPRTPEAELRALLLQAGVEIVRGPSALGLYQLAPLEGTKLSKARDVLQGSDLIESLEVSDE